MITKKESYFLAQLWTYDNLTKALSCKEGEWEYQNVTWELPAIGTEGFIMDSLNSKVLTVNGSSESGTRVVLGEVEQIIPNERQIWIIKPMRNREGFFTIGLVNPFLNTSSDELILTMSNSTTTTIEGKIINYGINIIVFDKERSKTFCSLFSKILENS